MIPYSTQNLPDHGGAAAQGVLTERLLVIGVGSYLLWLSLSTYGVRGPETAPEGILAVFASTAGAFATLAIGLLSSPRALSTTRNVAAALLLAVSAITFWARAGGAPGYGADPLALAHLAAEQTLAGRNPYLGAVDAVEVAQRFGLPEPALTQLESGGHIAALVSYPALHHLAFVPALALGLQDLRWVVFAFEVACGAVLWRATPGPLRFAPLLVLLTNSELAFGYALGGTTDWLWVLPLMLCAWQMHRRSTPLAGLWLGLAAATKQTPWVAAPFLVVWAFGTAGPSLAARFQAGARFSACAGLGFLIPNLPYLVADPAAWMRGALIPATAPLVPFGLGLSLLTQAGAPLPRSFYSAATLVMVALAVLVFGLLFHRLRAAIWLLPMAALWFNYRSLPSYLVFWIPVATLGTLLEAGRPPAAPPIGSRAALGMGVSRLAVLATLGCLAGLTLLGWSLRVSPGFKLQALSTATGDLNRVTSIRVQVTNGGQSRAAPAFSVLWGSYPHGWLSDGPSALAPDQTAVYELRPPSLQAAPAARLAPDGQLAFPPLLVRAAAGTSTYDVLALSPSVAAIPPLLNPTFNYWSDLFGGGAPYGWRTVVKEGPFAQASAFSAGQGRGVLLQLDRGAMSGWAEAGLLQRTDLRACAALRLVSSRSFDYAVAEDGSPTAMVGIEVRGADALSPIAWFALTTGESGTRVLPNGDFRATVHAPRSADAVDIQLESLLRTAGQELPSDGLLKLFIAVFEGPGLHRFEVQRAECLPARAPR